MAKDAIPFLGIDIERRADMDPDIAAKKILSSWLRPIINRDWPERLALIEEVDMSIQADFGEGDLSRHISQTFTEKVVERLRPDAVICKEQAFVYLNSKAPMHQQAGRAWLLLHEPDLGLFQEAPLVDRGQTASERRKAARHHFDLPGTVSVDGHIIDAKMVDLSMTGACLTAQNAPQAGTQVFLDIALVGRMAASVVWVTSTLMGLMFITDQAPGLL